MTVRPEIDRLGRGERVAGAFAEVFVTKSLPAVLFVCVENSCRSQMAEGFARALGEGRVQSFSAGSRPSGAVDARATAFMAERGIDLSSQSSKGLANLPERVEWDYVITMGCGDACPHLPARLRLDWDLSDPKGLNDKDFRRVRDEIERRVTGLLARVAGESGRPRQESGT